MNVDGNRCHTRKASWVQLLNLVIYSENRVGPNDGEGNLMSACGRKALIVGRTVWDMRWQAVGADRTAVGRGGREYRKREQCVRMREHGQRIERETLVSYSRA